MRKLKGLSVLLIMIMIMIPFVSCTSNDGGGSDDEVSSQTPSDSALDEVSNPQEDDTEEYVAPPRPDDSGKTMVRLGVLKGPTGIGAVNLIDKGAASMALNGYDVTLAGAPDEITSQILAGEIDIAAVPTNLASILYNKTEGQVQMLAINTLGVIHMLSTVVENIEDLPGHTIVMAGQGTVNEYAVRHILYMNGINPDEDVTLEFKTEHSEVASLFLAGEADVVILPEPFATQAITQKPNDGLEDILFVTDLSAEWDKVEETSKLAMGCVVVRKDFADNNLQAVKDFLTEYKESIDLANNDIETTAQLCERYDIIKSSVAQLAIPGCNMVYIDSTGDMQGVITGFFEVLYHANPESIGGNIPGEDFFFING